MATIAEQFRMRDTKRADGVRIIWTRETLDDSDSHPLDWMDKTQDADRLAAYRRGEFSMIGIRAMADIEVTSNGTSIVHCMTSAGCWGIESDSGADYLDEVYREECASILHSLRVIAQADLSEDVLP